MKPQFSLTWRFALYLLILLLSAVPALFVNSFNGYGPALIALLCFLLSLAQMFLVGRRVRFGANGGTVSCLRGESADFSVTAENTARLLPAMAEAELYMRDRHGAERSSKSVALTLSAGERRGFGYGVDFSHIGVYTVGVRSFTVRDLLGMARLWREDGGECRIEILPRTVSLETLPVSSETRTETSRAVTASSLSGTDYTGVRDYAFGDPIKSIHWKLSAHAGGLMTKQTESYTSTGLTVIMDVELPAYDEALRLDAFDGIVEIAASAANYAVKEGIEPCELLFFDAAGLKRKVPYTAFNDFHAFLGDLRMRAPSPDGATAAEALLRECTGMYAQANVALCTAALTEEAISALTALKRARKNPMVFFLLPAGIYDRERQERLAPLKRLEQMGIVCRVGKTAADFVS